MGEKRELGIKNYGRDVLFAFTFILYSLFFILTLPPSAEAATIKLGASTQGLVGYWTFDEGAGTTAADHSGHGNTGTLSGATKPTWTSGRLGNALVFSGTTNYVSIPVLQPNTFVTITLSVWMRATVLPVSSNRAVQVASNSAWLGVDSSGDVESNIYDGSSNKFLSSSGTSYLNQWVHAVVTEDGTTEKLYVNGSLVGSRAAGGVNWFSETNVKIGAEDGLTSPYYFQGTIDDVRIYSRALPASEVFALYVAGEAKVNSSNLMLSSGSSLSTGLVGYWPLDNSTINWATGAVTDKSGSGNTGTLNNFSTTTSPIIGRIGQALQFNGTNTFIQSTLSSSLQTANVTISLWWKARSTGGFQYLIDTNSDSGTVGYTFQVAPTLTSYYITFAPGVTDKLAGFTFTPGNWYHIVATYDGSRAVVYINGIQRSTASGSGNIAYSGGSFRIGGNQGSNVRASGIIDDVRIYNRALSASEVQQLYRLGQTAVNTASQNRTTASSLTSGLVGLWTFDGPQTQTTIADSSGQGNNGYVAGGVATSSMKTIGKIGQALRFDGATNYLTIPDSTSLHVGSAFTASAWIKPTLKNNRFVVFSTRIGNPAGGWQIEYGDPGVGSCTNGCVTVTGASTFINVSPNAVAPINTWSLVTYVHLSGTTSGSLYVNGVLQTPQQSTTYTFSDNTASKQIGASGLSTGQYFPGSIDDVRIYNRALTASEVLQLYTLGK